MGPFAVLRLAYQKSRKERSLTENRRPIRAELRFLTGDGDGAILRDRQAKVRLISPRGVGSALS